MTAYGEASDLEPPSSSALLKMGTWLRRGTTSSDTRQLFLKGGRDADVFYRKRWAHDKVVRSTHGVNCTGSCSWKIYVKDGIITWESQETDYPSTGPDMPDYEPRGCPRGASFSWYEYSPTRIRHPYVRSILLDAWRDKLAELGDPVDAILRQVLCDTSGADVGVVHPQATDRFEEVQDHLALTERDGHHGQGADLHAARAHRHQVGGDAVQFHHQHPHVRVLFLCLRFCADQLTS